MTRFTFCLPITKALADKNYSHTNGSKLISIFIICISFLKVNDDNYNEPWPQARKTHVVLYQNAYTGKIGIQY